MGEREYKNDRDIRRKRYKEKVIQGEMIQGERDTRRKRYKEKEIQGESDTRRN